MYIETSSDNDDMPTHVIMSDLKKALWGAQNEFFSFEKSTTVLLLAYRIAF